MTSIGELFPKCRLLLYNCKQQLTQVQNGVLYPSELFISLDELSTQLQIMEQLAQREIPAKREEWTHKILTLQNDSKSIRRSAEHYDRMVNSNIKQQKEREELLTRRRKSNNPNANSEEWELNNLSSEGKSLDSSQYMANTLINSGQASLTEMVSQRQRLRGIRGWVHQIGNKLDLTNSTMRIIERRDITDAYLVFAGMVITCLVIYFLWF